MLVALLRDRAFRLLWAGEAVAVVAEQLLLVALAVLVLEAAGPGAALGAVLAVAAVPRAVLLPFGGVLADRVAPVRIAVATTWARAALLAVLALAAAGGAPPLWAIALLAGLLGALDAAYYPAALALLPEVVDAPRLPAANALVQGAESAGDLLGPALAAGLIAAAGVAGAIGAVGALYAAAALALTVFARRVARRAAARPAAAPHPRPLTALREGVRFARREPVLRTILIVLLVLNLAVAGPVVVGGVVLADARLGGADALALVFAAFGAGSLAGLLAAGARAPRRRGLVLAATLAALGAALGGFGLARGLPAALALAALMGVAAGYLGVVIVAWLQERAPAALRGRLMGLVAFCAVAFDPLSLALAGALLPAGLGVLFGAAGALVLAAAAAVLLTPAVRALP